MQLSAQQNTQLNSMADLSTTAATENIIVVSKETCLSEEDLNPSLTENKESEKTPLLVGEAKRKAKKSKWESDSGDEDQEGRTPRKKVKREKKKKDNTTRDIATKTGTTIAPTSRVIDIEDEGDGTEVQVANESAHDRQVVVISDDLPSEEASTSLPLTPPPRSPSPPTAPDYPTLSGCRSVEHYEKLNRIEEGAYGVVYRAREMATGTVVALKKLKLEKEKNGFPITSLREIHTLLLVAGHPNIVNVREIVVGGRLDSIYIVMDFIEHDLKSLMSNMPSPFLQSEVKTLLLQLLSACACLHTNWIVHRDLKTSNLLLNNRGEIKVADFGLARKFGSPLGHMTQLVVTLWYRAPELLLGAKEYSTEIDMWSVGCIFAELVNKEPLVPGKSEIDQLDKIFRLLGMPNERIWPGFSKLPNAQNTTFVSQPYNTLRSRFTYLTEAGLDLMTRLLTYDPKQRITAEQAMKHPYFSETPLPKDPSMFPTWPSKGSGEKRKTFVSPSAPQATHAGGLEGNEEDLYSLFDNSETGGGGTGFRLKLGM